MSFKINSLYLTDGYKVGHKKMLAPGTTKLYGTWIPRSTKHAPKGINTIVSFGQQLVWKWIHDEFDENFFRRDEIDSDFSRLLCTINDKDLQARKKLHKQCSENVKNEAMSFIKDMSLYLGMEYDGKHFEELWDLGYLPIKVKSLPEGIETNPNIPHMTFVNTVDGFAWLTLYLETIVSSLAWKPSTSATIALQYRRNVEKWVKKTDPTQSFLIPFLCHDFSARGLNPWDMITSGLGHATSFRGSDTLPVIPAARYFYNESEEEVCINSVNASEHSVSTTKIFTVGEKQMIIDWCKEFPIGILSIVADTFDLWKLITEYLTDPEVKEAILARDGKLVIRPDSGDPVDIICGYQGVMAPRIQGFREDYKKYDNLVNTDCCHTPEWKGVIELLWDIFGGTINEQGYKILNPHIGAIYGDSINLERQIQIYERLAAKGFAATNIVLGVGSFTYQFNTRDTFGFAAKGAWFEADGKSYNIYKDPVTDDGTKKSLKGLLMVRKVNDYGQNSPEIKVFAEQTPLQESTGLLQVIYEDGEFYNQTTLTKIRENLSKISLEN
jgi:nicotinamide phosphoribosyltransferase